MSNANPAFTGHVAALDGLRAIAVTAVIVYHASVTPTHPTIVDSGYQVIAKGGWAGVDLFFVLSGFLITGILLDTKRKPSFFRNFYIRRTLRIFPLYYAVLVAVLIIGPHVLPSTSPEIKHILARQVSLWTYTSNIDVFIQGDWFFNAGWMHLTHLWSLAIEEQFYMLWPLLVFALPRRGLVAVALLLVVGAPILRIVMLHDGTSSKVVYSFTACRIDTLAIGSLLAVVNRVQPHHALRVCRWLIGIGGIATAVVIGVAGGLDADAWAVQTVGFSALAVLFGGVVLGVVRSPRARTSILTRPALTMIGRYSYGIYLLHGLLEPFLGSVFDVESIGARVHSWLLAQLAFMVLLFVLSTLIAAVSWHVFERHFLSLKDRWAPRSKTALGPTQRLVIYPPPEQ